MKRWVLPAVLLLLVIGTAAAAFFRLPLPAAGAPAGVPVLVELFTSEGCSSCPPADAFALELEQQQPVPGAEVVVLSQHVDYWNRLGWQDPYSAPAFTARQYAYARTFGTDQVYTPQMVIDGQQEFPGGNRSKALAAVAAAAKAPKARLQLTLAPARAAALEVQVTVQEVPAALQADTLQVWLALAEEGLETHVRRGENKGRLLRHPSVAHQLLRLPPWLKNDQLAYRQQATLSVPEHNHLKRLRVVAFLQQLPQHRVVGVTQLRL